MNKRTVTFIKLILIVMLLAAIGVVLLPETVPFPDLKRPGSIAVDSDGIFVNDGAEIYIYSPVDFKLLKRFGKAGEGPMEFKVHPNINRGGIQLNVQKNSLLVNSLGRLSVFSRDGKYIEEMNTKTIVGHFWRLGRQYVGLGFEIAGPKQYFVVNLYDNDFNRGKEMFRTLAFEDGKNMNPVSVGLFPTLVVYKEKIYINASDGSIHVFDAGGNPLTTLGLATAGVDYTPLKVTEEDKQRYIGFFKADPRYKAVFQRDTKDVEFPVLFPVLKDYRIADDRVYMVTFKKAGGERELFILDLNGRLIKHITVALQEMNPRELVPFAIKNGKLYQLVENPGTEEWELRIEAIE